MMLLLLYALTVEARFQAHIRHDDSNAQDQGFLHSANIRYPIIRFINSNVFRPKQSPRVTNKYS